MIDPYIGICDFTSNEQVLRSARLMRRLCGRSLKTEDRWLMAGVMMSYKTMHEIPSRWTKAWPSKDEVASIFSNYPFVLNTLHYADYDGLTTTADLVQAVKYGGHWLNCIQLDMVWPDPIIVAGLRKYAPEIGVVLQINSRALDAVSDDPHSLVRRLGLYGSSLDAVLLDKSHGRGLGMDAVGLLPFLRAISKKIPKLALGAAGGLGPDTMDLAEPLVKEFPCLSIDAQGRLRPSGNAMDPIDWDMADTYLRNAVALFSR